MLDHLTDAARVALVVALVLVGVRYVRVVGSAKASVPRPPVTRTTRVQSRVDLYARDPGARLETFRELERLAAANPERRQKVVDSVLEQLRFRGWSEMPDWQDRLWALVVPHLRPHTREFWPGIDLRLDFHCGAVLTDVDLSNCEIRNAAFERVRFTGDANFKFAVFTGDVTFEGSCFARHARFRQVKFGGAAAFDDVTFTGTAWFPRIEVAGPASFTRARFSGHTEFTGAAFAGPFSAIGAGFAGRASFRDTHFGGRTRFADARFTGHADFTGTSFVDTPGLARAWARTDRYTVRTWPDGWTLDADEAELPKRPGRWAELKQ